MVYIMVYIMINHQAIRTKCTLHLPFAAAKLRRLSRNTRGVYGSPGSAHRIFPVLTLEPRPTVGRMARKFRGENSHVQRVPVWLMIYIWVVDDDSHVT